MPSWYNLTSCASPKNAVPPAPIYKFLNSFEVLPKSCAFAAPGVMCPLESMRSLWEPAVSTENWSAPGNLIAVFVSPAWTILSAIATSSPKVPPAETFILLTSNWSVINIP